MLKGILIFGKKNSYFYFYLLSIQTPWTYQKGSFLYSKEPLLNKIFRQKSVQIRRVNQNMYQIFLGALAHKIVSSLIEV